MTDIPAKIRLFRENAGLTRKEFGAKTATSEAKIQKMEIGAQRIDHDFLNVLADTMNLDMNWLFSGNSSDPTHKNYVEIEKITVSGSRCNGAGFAFDEQWLSSRHLSAEDIKAFTVQGDSMEPHLRDGVVVLFDQSQTDPIQGKTYVLKIGGTVMINYVQHLGTNKIRFLSANTIYGHSDFDPTTDGDQYEVLGRVVAAIQDF